ncbi:MAG: ATP-binding protein [Pseudomonadota bacterium]
MSVPPGAVTAPVSFFDPKASSAVPLDDLLPLALPELSDAVRVLGNLPDWVSDSIAAAPPAIRDSAEKSLSHMADQIARTRAIVRALSACRELGDYVPRPVLCDTTALITQAALAHGSDRADLQIELTPALTDPRLLEGIVSGLLDAAEACARRRSDRIALKAIGAPGAHRVSVIYPGKPIPEAARRNLFDGVPTPDLPIPPAASVGLVYVWHATRLLDGQIEVGAGFGGTGARITCILPSEVSRK